MTDTTGQMTDTTEFHRRRKLLADYLRGVPDTHYCHDTFAVVFPDGWLDEHYYKVTEHIAENGGSFGDSIVNLCLDECGEQVADMIPINNLLKCSATACGTAACASGWAAFGVTNDNLAIPRNVAGDEGSLAYWLGYSGDRHDSPFWELAYDKDLGDVTKADVIAYLERGI